MAEASTDLIDRADVEALLRRFYGRALADEVLAAPFSELLAVGLDSHIPTMCDFWETVLFRAGRYRGSAAGAPRHPPADTPVQPALSALAHHLARHRRRNVLRGSG